MASAKANKKTTTKKRPVGKKSVAKKKPAKRGRPTSYNPAWIEKLPGMFSKGQSVLEVSIALGVSRDSMYEYAKMYPDFSDALTRGKEISQAWWEKIGRENLFDVTTYDSKTKTSTRKCLNDRHWKYNMSCRFRADWTEKTEISGPDGSPFAFTVTFVSPKDAGNQDQ